MSGNKTHFGDPCVHCGTPQMEVAPGGCTGDFSKALVIGYASLGVRHDGVEHYRYRLSENTVHDSWQHVSYHAPYYHFGRKGDLTNPPPYDLRLRDREPTP
jgi:hypothetical protein